MNLTEDITRMVMADPDAKVDLLSALASRDLTANERRTAIDRAIAHAVSRDDSASPSARYESAVMATRAMRARLGIAN